MVVVVVVVVSSGGRRHVENPAAFLVTCAARQCSLQAGRWPGEQMSVWVPCSCSCSFDDDVALFKEYGGIGRHVDYLIPYLPYFLLGSRICSS